MTRGLRTCKILYLEKKIKEESNKDIMDELEQEKNKMFQQALTERLAQIVAEYEVKVAELRVEYTLVANELARLQKANEATPDTAKSD